MAVIISLSLAIFFMCYAGWLHIYYSRRRRSLREVQVEKFIDYMKGLGYDTSEIEEHIKNYPTLADLCEVNQKMKKAFKKFGKVR